MPDERRVERGRFALVVRIAVLAALILIAFVSLAAMWFEWGQEFSIQHIEETIQSWGMWGVIASIGLMVLHSFVPFPAEFLAFANGMIYGPLWGTVITWSGAMLGAFAAFALTRLLGRPFVEFMVARHDWRVLDDWAAREGAQLVFISRFLPFIAFNLINYAAGLIRISWWTFAWTTGVGILPLTALMVYMGDNAESLSWQSWLLLLGAALIVCLVLRRKVRILPAKKKEDTS